jgi:hypothetical protein
VHAIVVAPVLIRVQMLRIARTYDLLITRHQLAKSGDNQRPRLESSVLFYGRRGGLEMELWGEDATFSRAVCPVFYTRAGECVVLPNDFQNAATRIVCRVLSRLPSLSFTRAQGGRPRSDEESQRSRCNRGARRER